MKLRFVKHHTKNNYIDTDTGEVLSTHLDKKEEYILVDSPEDFANVFFHIKGILSDLDKGSVNLLIWCATQAQYNTNMVTLNKPVCTLIEKDLGIKYQTIKNAITRLVKKKIFIPMGSATYKINPAYAWRGAQEVRKREMHYILTLKQDLSYVPEDMIDKTRSVATDIEKQRHARKRKAKVINALDAHISKLEDGTD